MYLIIFSLRSLCTVVQFTNYRTVNVLLNSFEYLRQQEEEERREEEANMSGSAQPSAAKRTVHTVLLWTPEHDRYMHTKIHLFPGSFLVNICMYIQLFYSN